MWDKIILFILFPAHYICDYIYTLSHIFPSYTLGQLNIFNFFLYNFIDNSRKYDWKEWDSSKSMKDQFFHS